METKYICTLIILLVSISPVLATGETFIVGNIYTDEYYFLKDLVDKFINDDRINTTYGEGTLTWNDNIGSYAMLATLRETRRQNILLEKQNELLVEQNKIGWIQACYVPHEGYAVQGYSQNITALKYACRIAGYPTNTWD